MAIKSQESIRLRRKYAEELNESKSEVRMTNIESTMEDLSVIILDDLTDLSAPVGIEESYSSNVEELCDEEYEGMLMGEDTSAFVVTG